MLQYVHEVEVDQLRLQVIRFIARGVEPSFVYLDVFFQADDADGLHVGGEIGVVCNQSLSRRCG